MFPASCNRGWYSTNLLQPLPGAFHPARRRNCILRNLSVRLYRDKAISINSSIENRIVFGVKARHTSVCQPYRLDDMHIALNQSIVNTVVRKPSCYFCCFLSFQSNVNCRVDKKLQRRIRASRIKHRSFLS